MSDDWLDGLDVPDYTAREIRSGEPERVDDLAVTDDPLPVMTDDREPERIREPQTFQELNVEIIRLTRELDGDIRRLYRASIMHAKRKDALRRAEVKARFVAREELEREHGIEKSTDADRGAYVAEQTADLQFEVDAQAAIADAAREAGRSRRDQLSAWQTVSANLRREWDREHSGPQENA